MAIGCKRSDFEGFPCKISESRLCESCELVTERLACPLCDVATVEHEERKSEFPRYCVDCADEFTDVDVRVKTWSFSPYDQCEGGLVFVCRSCLQAAWDGGNPQAIWKE